MNKINLSFMFHFLQVVSNTLSCALSSIRLRVSLLAWFQNIEKHHKLTCFTFNYLPPSREPLTEFAYLLNQIKQWPLQDPNIKTTNGQQCCQDNSPVLVPVLAYGRCLKLTNITHLLNMIRLFHFMFSKKQIMLNLGLAIALT